ncbi:uncharacterized protein LOC141531480 isoform X3 [Cotesia typhae]|uniref:uncharacterized protein LOC141531480 isoform X3 n=1 Tax=Cotesia typhae TaxID=2053667 RepID=UPI003D68BC30
MSKILFSYFFFFYSFNCHVKRTREMDDQLIWIRIVDYREKFNVRRWQDADIGIARLWNEIANDSRLQGRYTAVECWDRFSLFVEYYNYLKAIPETRPPHPRCMWTRTRCR